jgi:hypothetical protein
LDTKEWFSKKILFFDFWTKMWATKISDKHMICQCTPQ